MNTDSQAEYQLLYSLFVTRKRGRGSDQKTLEDLGKKIFADALEDWRDTYDSLLGKEYLLKENECYFFTPLGNQVIRQWREEKMISMFNESLLLSANSKTYGLYCERLYGKNLFQYNMMDMEQLTRMLEILDIQPGEKVLDIACGIGVVTEYIAQQTGAIVTGIDFASEIIALSERRTAHVRDRVKYRTLNMNNLWELGDRFDTIYAIDTLYFVDDLHVTVGDIKSLLTDEGQMGIFWEQWIEPAESCDLLQPDQTLLARELANHGLHFQDYEFTQATKVFWRRAVDLAEELKEAFEEEGSSSIYRGIIEEGIQQRDRANDDRIRRYFYHVRNITK